MLRPDEIDKILNKHIANYFESISAADEIDENSVFEKVFMAPIAAFIQCSTSKGAAT